MLEGDDDELERLGAQRRVVDEKIVDVVGGGVDAVTEETCVEPLLLEETT